MRWQATKPQKRRGKGKSKFVFVLLYTFANTLGIIEQSQEKAEEQTLEGDIELCWEDIDPKFMPINFSVTTDYTWAELCEKVRQDENATLFWANPQTWKQYGRNNHGIPMCVQEDLTEMLRQAKENGWKFVKVYDSSDQFPDERED